MSHEHADKEVWIVKTRRLSSVDFDTKGTWAIDFPIFCDSREEAENMALIRNDLFEDRWEHKAFRYVCVEEER